MRFAASHSIEPDQKTEKMGKTENPGWEGHGCPSPSCRGFPPAFLFLPVSGQAAFAFLFFSSTMEILFIVSRRTVSEISKRAAASR